MIFYKQKEIITNVIPNRLLVEEEGGQEGWKTCGKGVEGGWGPAVAVKPRAPRRVSPAQGRAFIQNITNAVQTLNLKKHGQVGQSGAPGRLSDECVTRPTDQPTDQWTQPIIPKDVSESCPGVIHSVPFTENFITKMAY